MTPERSAKRKRVVITRSREGNEELAGRVRALGFEPVTVDSIDVLPPRDWKEIDASLRRLGEYDWLVFTSGNGARLFGERMKALALDLPWQGKPSVAAVGEGTAEELRRLDLPVGFVPSEFLTLTLASELPMKAGRSRVLLLRADIADHRMVELLRGRGFEVAEHAIYRTETFRPGSRAPVELGMVDAILFASPSAVDGFASRLGGKGASEMRRTLAACIGPVTAKKAKERGFERIITPKQHTFDALLQEVGRELSMVTR